MEKNLNDFLVGSVPTLFYIPNFISDSEEEQLLNNIYQAPASKWKYMKNRRLQNWGGIVHEKGLLAQALPPWLTRITRRISEESRLFPSPINHVLINEYLPNQGIMPHQDGPAYFPVVAILSLGSPVVMDFNPHPSLRLSPNSLCNNIEDKDSDGADFETDRWVDDHHPFFVVLMPRSLLIFKDEAYSDSLLAIVFALMDVEEDKSQAPKTRRKMKFDQFFDVCCFKSLTSDYLHGIKDCEVQQLDGAVNFSEISKHISTEQQSEAIQVEATGDCSNIHRKTTRISLTCRMVPKVYKNLFKI